MLKQVTQSSNLFINSRYFECVSIRLWLYKIHVFIFGETKLKRPPIVGEIIAATYLDDDLYRGIVTKIVNDKEVMVKYVDFGNEDPCLVENLRMVPNNFIEVSVNIVFDKNRRNKCLIFGQN